ncbi:Nif11-like leader peptide family natural product precursor [Propionibacterium sp.]|uniref:Nif11-like leader peptide family natural product precursor n=1 Tax=Propionibacterium sp. TaxID=1977903 RepID=UPI0039E8F9AB
MSTDEVERLLVAGGADKKLRIRYDQADTMEDFVALADSEGFKFTDEELKQVLREAGDSFESQGNPRARQIWWS